MLFIRDWDRSHWSPRICTFSASASIEPVRPTKPSVSGRRALAKDPEHAETLQELTRLYTTRNRLAEAAVLAERLARKPGWELGAELTLGSLRSELNDPEGAVSVLRRGLARAEAASLEPELESKYRKLLVRSLLKTSGPDLARAALEPLLDRGPDAEVSWLLSRVALASGSVAEAATALGAGESYRKAHPLESEPSPYVGEARCALCHTEQCDAQQASRHARTLLRGDELAKLPYPDRPTTDPGNPGVTHTFIREQGQVGVETRVQNEVRRAVIQYAFGSRDHYTSLVGADSQGTPYIFRLSHYQSGGDSGWVRTTGHSADPGEGRDFLGKPLDVLDGIHRCLFCHATNPVAVLKQSGPESGDRGIGCERCHGPGGLHVKAVEVKFRDRAIINPNRATAEGRLRICGQCHSYHGYSPLPRTDTFWIRYQGTTLPWSRCYTESGGALDCTTCHDPHRTDPIKDADSTAKCLTCHSPSAAPPRPAGDAIAVTPASGRGAPCPVNPARNCVACHMPPYWSEPIHATFTDHYIRVHRELSNQNRK